MLPLLTDFTAWIAKLSEPGGLLLLGALLISMTFWHRRVPASEVERSPAPMPKAVRRRITSATGLTAQRGHS